MSHGDPAIRCHRWWQKKGRRWDGRQKRTLGRNARPEAKAEEFDQRKRREVHKGQNEHQLCSSKCIIETLVTSMNSLKLWNYMQKINQQAGSMWQGTVIQYQDSCQVFDDSSEQEVPLAESSPFFALLLISGRLQPWAEGSFLERLMPNGQRTRWPWHLRKENLENAEPEVSRFESTWFCRSASRSLNSLTFALAALLQLFSMLVMLIISSSMKHPLLYISRLGPWNAARFGPLDDRMKKMWQCITEDLQQRIL